MEWNAYLRRILLQRDEVPTFDDYPFHLPAISSLSQLELHPKVTYIIGENGMGKSTLLEGIAVALGFNPEGGTMNFSFATAETHSELHRYLRTVRGRRGRGTGSFFGRRAIITWLRRSIGWTVNPPLAGLYAIPMAENRCMRCRMGNRFCRVYEPLQRVWLVHLGRAGGGVVPVPAAGDAVADS